MAGRLLARRAQGHFEGQRLTLFRFRVAVVHLHLVDGRQRVVIDDGARGVLATHRQFQGLVGFVHAVINGRHGHGEAGHARRHQHALAVGTQGHAVAEGHALTVEVTLTRGHAR